MEPRKEHQLPQSRQKTVAPLLRAEPQDLARSVCPLTGLQGPKRALTEAAATQHTARNETAEGHSSAAATNEVHKAAIPLSDQGDRILQDGDPQAQVAQAVEEEAVVRLPSWRRAEVAEEIRMQGKASGIYTPQHGRNESRGRRRHMEGCSARTDSLCQTASRS